MIALATTIFVSSLIGSVHCVAMCGPLVGLHGGLRTLPLALFHALGRLTTYVALGMIAGLVGRAIDVAGDLGVVQRAATLVAGAAILALGGFQLAVAFGWRSKLASRGGGSLFTRGLVQLRTRPPATRAWLIGVLTGLLPCGWLWAFVVAAAGTGEAVSGGVVMMVFWLGTVPAMLGVLTLGGPVIAWVRSRLPVITALVMIALGVATLAMRWHDAGATGVAQPSCHEVSP